MAKVRTEEQKRRKAESDAKYYAANKDKIDAYKASWYRQNSEEVIARMAAWRLANPEIVKAQNARYPKENEESVKKNKAEYRILNLSKLSAYYSNWQKENPHKVNAICNKHRAAKYNAIPAWADEDKICSIYAFARERTVLTGVPHQVDHIVPLQGRIVCGLHVEDNLQVIPKRENASKGNRHWPDMPGGR